MPVTTFPMPASGGGGGDGTSIVDDAAFTVGVTRLTPGGGTYRSTRDAVNDGDAGAFAITATRALYTTIETPDGDSAMDDTNDAVKVNIVAGAGSGGTSSNFGAALPSAGTAVGFSDGTNMEAARVYDTDSGGGSELTLGVSLRKTASGGSVEAGTLADPLRIDPVGTTTQPATLIPATSGGLATYHLVSAASTNATNVKASAGQLFGWYLYNSNAAARKVAFHNTAGTPTAGADIFFSVMIPPGSAANVFSDIGIAFSTGIAFTTVTEVADNGTTGVGANDLIINLFYK